MCHELTPLHSARAAKTQRIRELRGQIGELTKQLEEAPSKEAYEELVEKVSLAW
jgi:hypothetical protein